MGSMIFINVKFHVKPEYADTFLDEINWYTEACNAEPGCLELDRKSTRLNSSHVAISYAVFCLKKKKIRKETSPKRSVNSYITRRHAAQPANIVRTGTAR